MRGGDSHSRRDQTVCKVRRWFLSHRQTKVDARLNNESKTSRFLVVSPKTGGEWDDIVSTCLQGT